MSVPVLLAVAALVLAHDAGGAGQPALKLRAMRPFTVAGKGFRAHERVRLVLHQSSGASHRRATASSSGAFSRAFAGVTVDRCSGFWVSATGAAGSRARLTRRARPECPAP